MDEILIEGKKYVSSKQATKLTGYAKDYIGQLCREGRVPARLVGRSWYVLETAMTEHRFGKEAGDGKEKNQMKAPEEMKEAKPVFSPTWETPRYEAVKEQDISERLQDSWREWFNRIGDSSPVIENETEKEKEENSQEQESENEDTEEVPVAIRAVHHHPLPAELPPRALKDYRHESSVSETRVESEYGEELRAGNRARRGRGRTLQLLGVLFALALAGSAVLGTGYFDSYLLSHGEIRGIAGLGLYDK